MKKAPAILLLLAAAALSCGFLEFIFDEAHKGNEAFARGRYDQAAKHYTEAQINDPANPRLDLNLGAALYKQEKLDDAATAFRKAFSSDDADVAADAHYNTGNALFSQQKLDEAILEYTETLKIRPDDEDAKFNLELARRLLQQREEKDQEKEDQNQKQQDQQEQQESQEKEEDKKDQEQPAEKESPEKQEDKEQKEEATPQVLPEKMEELTPEQAARILDALKDEEKDEISKQLLPSSGTLETDKDW